ncbi:secreted RxLR effector protein 161-like [Salvia splendens]|uniref:secreted RxLR effector protein 161-like n=1 Tax=Salvia splendens TaxID=180675 RepID=UPI001C261122|nr:secreted RxLR effector protein 161-like [Salvia splendens]
MRSTTTPLAMHFKLSKELKAVCEAGRKEMELIPYSNIVGSIMYLMICTRPNIARAISTTSRYMSEFERQHWNALKWTLRYLKEDDKMAILFTDEGGAEQEPLIAVCWKSNLQDVVALSTTETKYIALTSAVKESKWLMGLILDFGLRNVQQLSIVTIVEHYA